MFTLWLYLKKYYVMIVLVVPWVDWEVHGPWVSLDASVSFYPFRSPNRVGVTMPSPIVLPLDHGVI